MSTEAYAGVCLHGRVVAGYTASPDHAVDASKWIADWLGRGLTVSKRPAVVLESCEECRAR